MIYEELGYSNGCYAEFIVKYCRCDVKMEMDL